MSWFDNTDCKLNKLNSVNRKANISQFKHHLINQIAVNLLRTYFTNLNNKIWYNTKMFYGNYIRSFNALMQWFSN